MEVRLDDVEFGYNPKVPVIKNINLNLKGNKLVSIIGPNGVGKSTLIHCINKILVPTKGNVYINGECVDDYKLKDLAKIVGYVPCTSSDAFPLSVVDTVLLGRNPHSKWSTLDDDLRKVHKVLKLLEIEHLAMRPFNELSAGQHQKVMLARGLAQEPQILMLDEPTSNLDIKHQVAVTRLLHDLTRTDNVLVIMISHDLNIASKYSDEMILMFEGEIFAVGAPEEVITSENIDYVYGVKSKIITNQNRPHIILEDDYVAQHHTISEASGVQCQTAQI